MSTVLERPISDYELERGKPMPSKNHAKIQTYLIGKLLAFEDQFETMSELTLSFNNKDVTPDISIFPKLTFDWQHDEVKMNQAPLVAIEILSPKQTLDDLMEKIDFYLDSGVKSCWLVQPVFETIAIFTKEQRKPHVFTAGELTDPVTGIKIHLKDIFR